MTAAPAEVTTPFERVGGEPGVRQLVGRFYDLIERQMEATRAQRLAESYYGTADWMRNRGG